MAYADSNHVQLVYGLLRIADNPLGVDNCAAFPGRSTLVDSLQNRLQWGRLSGSRSCSRGDGFLAGRPFSVGLDPNHTGLFGRERPLSLERPAVYSLVFLQFIPALSP